MAYHAVLAARGFLAAVDLDGFGAFDSPLGFHPDATLVPGVEISSGSLGHGLAAPAIEDQRERFYRLMPELLREDPRRVALGVGQAELRRYGTTTEHDAAHGLDVPGLRHSIDDFLY